VGKKRVQGKATPSMGPCSIVGALRGQGRPARREGLRSKKYANEIRGKA